MILFCFVLTILFVLGYMVFSGFAYRHRMILRRGHSFSDIMDVLGSFVLCTVLLGVLAYVGFVAPPNIESYAILCGIVVVSLIVGGATHAVRSNHIALDQYQVRSCKKWAKRQDAVVKWSGGKKNTPRGLNVSIPLSLDISKIINGKIYRLLCLEKTSPDPFFKTWEYTLQLWSGGNLAESEHALSESPPSRAVFRLDEVFNESSALVHIWGEPKNVKIKVIDVPKLVVETPKQFL